MLSQLGRQTQSVMLGRAGCEGRVLRARRLSTSLSKSSDHMLGGKQGSPPVAWELGSTFCTHALVEAPPLAMHAQTGGSPAEATG